MAISELEKTMATLRLGLAEIQNKEQHFDAVIHQFKSQLLRFPRQVIYGQTGLDASLAAMGEIEERLADAVANRMRLLQIKKIASQELEALIVLKRVDESRTALGDLKRRAASATRNAEIRRLEEFIAVNSKLAEQTITDCCHDDHSERGTEQPYRRS